MNMNWSTEGDLQCGVFRKKGTAIKVHRTREHPYGGYESAFLADLVVYYLFEKSKANFRPTIYHGIYGDAGLVVFKGKKKASEIKDWLEEFQQTVNTAAGNHHLRFTAEIWTNEANSPTPAKED